MKASNFVLMCLCSVLVSCGTIPNTETEQPKVIAKTVQSSPAPVAAPAPETPPAPPRPPIDAMVGETGSSGPAPTGASPGIYYGDKPNLLVREYLYPTNKKPSIPLNLILFPKKPVSESEKTQYMFICELWKATYTLKQVYDKVSDPAVNAVSFYWMLTKKTPSEECSDLIKNYDYTRSQIYMSKKKLSLTKMYLVCELPSGLVTMNITDLKKEDDIILAMEAWLMNMRAFPKAGKEIKPYDLMNSVKIVLGAIGNLVKVN